MPASKQNPRLTTPFLIALMLAAQVACRAPQPARESTPREEATPPQALLLDRIFDRYTEAVGGREAVDRIETYAFRGAFEMRGKEGLRLPVKVYVKKPDKSLMEIDVPRVGLIRRGFSGGKGWNQTSFAGVTEDSPNELTELERDHDIYLARGIRGLYRSVRLEGRARLGGRDVYVVEGKPDEGPAEKMLFDAETGLLLRWDVVRRSPGRPNVFARVYLDDYREVGGVRVPFTVRYFMEPRELILRLSEVRHNVPLDDSMFAKPPAP